MTEENEREEIRILDERAKEIDAANGAELERVRADLDDVSRQRKDDLHGGRHGVAELHDLLIDRVSADLGGLAERSAKRFRVAMTVSLLERAKERVRRAEEARAQLAEYKTAASNLLANLNENDH